jgi:WD40 repeat protein
MQTNITTTENNASSQLAVKGISTLKLPSEPSLFVKFEMNSKLIVSMKLPNYNSDLAIIDLRTFKLLKKWQTRYVSWMNTINQGKLAIQVNRYVEVLNIYNLYSGKIDWEIDSTSVGQPFFFAKEISQNRLLAAHANKKVTLWDLSELVSTPTPTPCRIKNPLKTYNSIADDGNICDMAELATGEIACIIDEFIHVYELKEDMLLIVTHCLGHKDYITHMVVHKKSTEVLETLITLSKDGSIKEWNYKTGVCIRTLCENQVYEQRTAKIVENRYLLAINSRSEMISWDLDSTTGKHDVVTPRRVSNRLIKLNNENVLISLMNDQLPSGISFWAFNVISIS